MGFLLDWLHFCCSSRRKIYYLPRRYKFMSRLVACSVMMLCVCLLTSLFLNITRCYKPGEMNLYQKGRPSAVHIAFKTQSEKLPKLGPIEVIWGLDVRFFVCFVFLPCFSCMQFEA